MIEEKTFVQTEEDSLLRDVHSKALLNKDVYGLNEYQIRKNLAKQRKQKEQDTENRLQILEDNMKEIKSLLVQLIGKQ